MFSARAACIIFAMFAGGLATGMFGGATHAQPKVNVMYAFKGTAA
jgi:hypothetical protein